MLNVEFSILNSQFHICSDRPELDSPSRPTKLERLMRAIFKNQKVITWTIVSTIAYSIAATIQIHTDNSFSIAQLLSSPITIAIVGLMQTVLLWNHPQLRSAWLKLLAIQLATAIVLQVLILTAGWFTAIMAIATLGKTSTWSSFSDASTIVLLMFGIVSHSQFHICSIARRTRPLHNQPRILTP
jgi:hypothetical protein